LSLPYVAYARNDHRPKKLRVRKKTAFAPEAPAAPPEPIMATPRAPFTEPDEFGRLTARRGLPSRAVLAFFLNEIA
jgi:hypothetical protein